MNRTSLTELSIRAINRYLRLVCTDTAEKFSRNPYLWLAPYKIGQLLNRLTINQRCKNLDLWVCSLGGVGTTVLMEFLGDYITINCSSDTDGLKHFPVRPKKLPKGVKVLYLYGDPVDATNSLYRRNYHTAQSVKLSGRLPKARTLNDITASSLTIDPIGMAEHFKRWATDTEELNYPLLIVRYDEMWEHLEKILSFCNIPSDEIKKFPEKRARTPREYDPVVTQRLRELLNSTLELQNSLPPILEIQPTSS